MGVSAGLAYGLPTPLCTYPAVLFRSHALLHYVLPCLRPSVAWLVFCLRSLFDFYGASRFKAGMLLKKKKPSGLPSARLCPRALTLES
jgi:hypothetical protein